MTGVLPIDKPAGPTSHDLVVAARRALGVKRIGHTGTLDPFATGLLLLCIGPATRLAEYLTGLDKVYEATARLGVTTDTLDHTGAVLARADATGLDPGTVRDAFESLAGTRMQRPPVYSAKKIGGKRAYELARAGEAVEPEAVEVTIHALEVTRQEADEVDFRLRASSGTFVRAVARDAGDRLGVGAHLIRLRRTAIGSHDVAAALRADRLEDPEAVQTRLLSPLDALAHLPRVVLSDEERVRVGHGQRLPAEGRAAQGAVALVQGDHLVAVADVEDAVIRPRKVFG